MPSVLIQKAAPTWARTAVSLVSFLFFGPAFATDSSAATHYVSVSDPSCQGNDPCLATIQAGLDAAAPGDTVRVLPGEYVERVRIRARNEGSSDEADRIVLEADPTALPGAVVLRGEPNCRGRDLLDIARSRFVTIRGLTLADAGRRAIALRGGGSANRGIRIESTRIVGSCRDGIVVGPGNVDTLIVANRIHGQRRNGIHFRGNDGGPQAVVNNTIHRSGWNGVDLGSGRHQVLLLNNAITENGTDPRTIGGRLGVRRRGSAPEAAMLRSNLLCANRLGEIGPGVLDATDAGNLTPTGTEGLGVVASPGCGLGTVYGGVAGLDGVLDSEDDDFTLADASPAVGAGTDPSDLGVDVALGNPPFDIGAIQVVGDIDRPVLSIVSPTSGDAFVADSVLVAGNVVGAVSVEVNDIAAALTAGGFSATIPLREGVNTIVAVARNAAGQVGTAALAVTRDATPPEIVIAVPADGATLLDEVTNVAGTFLDNGFGGSSAASVSCNGVPAALAGGAFFAANVPLPVGPGTVTCTGTDASGNVAEASVDLVRDDGAVARIRVVSGNGQSGPVYSELADPLVVEVIEADGSPALGKDVVFRVVRDLGAVTTAGSGGRGVVVATDAAGRASVSWILGARAGAGTNRVEATAVGFQGVASFVASADPAGVGNIFVDAGFMQSGVVGEPLPLPFSVVVTDPYFNRLPGVPVAFSVVGGGGNFAGASDVVVATDSSGRAQAVLTLGPDEGRDNNVVDATFAGNPGLPASFNASGRVPGPAANTRVSGVVLDNQNDPLEGVTLRLDDGSQAQSGPNGQFLIQPALVGYTHLVADGSTAVAPGTYPRLEFEMVTVPGRDNDLGMPIFLLPLDIASGLSVDATTGGTLMLPNLPGFSLEVAPGSATFPGGGSSGVVSVTQVHADKSPMVPNFGQQPRLLLTVQPPGVHFDPPAALCLPNTDGLAPGQVTELYSFDHDLAQFVSIGTGTVSTDGTQVCSDPGFGIVEGGWHCGGNPVQTGSAGTCGTCERCQGSECVPRSGLRPQVAGNCQQEICSNGSATTTPSSSDVPSGPSDDCKREVCSNGSVTLVNDDGEVPPQPSDGCKQNICQNGSVVEQGGCDDCHTCDGDSCVTDTTKGPADGCCDGTMMDPATQCCEGSQVLEKRPDDPPAINLAQCPNRVPRVGFTAGFNGCGPAGGGDAVVPDNPNALPPCFGPEFTPACINHDICYSTCNQPQETCDGNFGSENMQLCMDFYAGSPLSAVGCFNNCMGFAVLYELAVSSFSFAYVSAQEEACQCCP